VEEVPYLSRNIVPVKPCQVNKKQMIRSFGLSRGWRPSVPIRIRNDTKGRQCDLARASTEKGLIPLRLEAGWCQPDIVLNNRNRFWCFGPVVVVLIAQLWLFAESGERIYPHRKSEIFQELG
jgi:hypothetical protein